MAKKCGRCNKPKGDTANSCNCGRPPKYKTAEELQAKIDEYFKSGHDTKEIYVKSGNKEYTKVNVPILSITGLTLYLGFADRVSFYDYENNEKFSYTIKRARTFIEKEYEQMLPFNPTGAIFALKNFGRSDRQEITQTNKYDIAQLEEMKASDLLQYIKGQH